MMRDNELYETGNFSSYGGDCSEAKFLLGGIGTGNFSVGSRGQMTDWEIFGTAGKGNYMPNTFFAIYAKPETQESVCRVLESRLSPPFSKPRGFLDYEVAGLPRFASSVCSSRYPFYTVELVDEELPVCVQMESFTPFIPLNADDSGIPTAIIRYRVKNRLDEPMSVSVAGSLSNMSSLKKYDKHTWEYYQSADDGVNEYREDGAVKGIRFRPDSLGTDSLYYGTLSLTTNHDDISYKRSWLNGGWWDGLQDFWDDFASDGHLEAESVYTQKDVTGEFSDLTGSLAVHQELAPYEERVFTFQISWSFPNRVNCWSRIMYDEALRPETEKAGSEVSETACDASEAVGKVDRSNDGYPVIRKYYARQFPDAWDAAVYTMNNLERLEGTSRTFTKAFYSGTLPAYVIEAAANNITVIRSNTCLRLFDGTFLAWEGCFDDEGCCEGTCTHVWNYAQTIAFLFPELERSMRRVEYGVETNPDGKMNFRSYQLWGMGGHGHVPAADGQMGTVVRFYREWKFSGDDKFLKEFWPTVRKTLDFAFDYWDKDGDYVFDTNQFNTYDIAFEGPSSMVNSLFYAALRAGEEMASYLGDTQCAARYRAAFEQGSKRMDEMLWGGKYYVQKVSDINEYRYQYGDGCLSDQVFGQTLAHITGLGYVLPEHHVKQAVKAIYDRNYKQDFTRFPNPQRTYLLNREKGLVLCSWEQEERPRLPFPYSDEVWTGIEYHVASHLIYEGFLEEGLTLVQNTRSRQDGIARSPWNEVECGHHYARSLASYGVYLALCGFQYDLPHGKISFAPKINQDDFRCFFSTGTCWGVYRQTRKPDGTIESDTEVLYGNLDGVLVNG